MPVGRSSPETNPGRFDALIGPLVAREIGPLPTEADPDVPIPPLRTGTSGVATESGLAEEPIECDEVLPPQTEEPLPSLVEAIDLTDGGAPEAVVDEPDTEAERARREEVLEPATMALDPSVPPPLAPDESGHLMPRETLEVFTPTDELPLPGTPESLLGQSLEPEAETVEPSEEGEATPPQPEVSAEPPEEVVDELGVAEAWPDDEPMPAVSETEPEDEALVTPVEEVREPIAGSPLAQGPPAEATPAPGVDPARLGEIADRLERIARSLRQRGAGGPLAEHGGDPLSALITGYLLGFAEGCTPQGDASEAEPAAPRN